MALIHCDFFSETLGISTSVCAILPQNTQTQVGMKGSKNRAKYPVLYLLHGLSDDHTIWQRRTSIERYASELGLVVIMPSVERSFYTDMHNGYDYWTYISEELPKIMASFFPISTAREDNFAAGLSMGGYGALKLVMSHPDKFAAGASLSGSLNMAESILSESNEKEKKELINIFGDLPSVKGSENDLFALAEGLHNYQNKPRLFQCCGTEDFLYQDNIKFRDFIKTKDFDLTYDEGPGTHEWGYWDSEIQKVLKWLPIR